MECAKCGHSKGQGLFGPRNPTSKNLSLGNNWKCRMIRAEIVHTVNMVMADTAHVIMVYTVNNLTGKLWKQWESCN